MLISKLMEVITSHTNADFDTFASMIAAGKLYPEARLVFSGSIEKGLREAIEKLELPYRFDRIKDIDLEKVKRIILVDVRETGRLGPFDALIKKGVEVHIYDHHPATGAEIKPAYEDIRPLGSTSTIMALIIRDRDLPVTPLDATLLMAGIYEDTGFLSYPSTTPHDFDAAGYLLTKGADLRSVSDFLKKELTPEEVALLNEFLQSETRYRIDGTEVVIAEGYLEKYAADISILAHKIRDIEGMDCLFLLVDAEDRVHLISRSRTPKVDVGKVARLIGGGGHATAASATLKGVTLIQAKETLLGALRKTVAPERKAADIMSFPAITLPPGMELRDSMEMMRRYNINAAPVVDENGVLLGVITRQVVDKAVYHGLGESKVADYMTTEFEEIESGASIEDIREKVIAHGTRILPVIKDGKVAGVITRTDLIKILQESLREAEKEGVGIHKARSLTRLVKDRLPSWAVELLKEAGHTAEDLGFQAYAVGGFVRDLLLRRDNLDIDIVVEGGNGIILAEEVASRKGARVRAHQRFKTAVIVFPDGFKMDVATARLEYYERPGALPTVEQSSLKLDLYRRDFIINTLAIALNPGKFGELIDFFGAQRDLKEKTIRVLHNLSFVEDPTRMLRAVRFSEKFGFRISKHTLNLIKNSVKLDMFKELSGARLFDELKNILEEDVSAKCIEKLHELGILKLIHQGITWDVDRELFFERAREAVAWHELLYTEEKAEGWLVLFLALTDPLNQDELERLAKRLSMEGRKVMEVIASRSEGLRGLRTVSMGMARKNSEIYGLLNGLPIEAMLYLIAKAGEDDAKKAISTYITRLRGIKTELGGEDLLAMGMKQGPAIGEVLEMLIKKRLDGEISTREEEEALAAEFIKNGGRIRD